MRSGARTHVSTVRTWLSTQVRTGVRARVSTVVRTSESTGVLTYIRKVGKKGKVRKIKIHLLILLNDNNK